MTEEYMAMPKRVLDGIGDMGTPPPPGSGRIRFDMAVNVWTLISLAIVLIVFGFALLRIHEQVGTLTQQMVTVINQQQVFAIEIHNLQTKQMLLRRDLGSFPLHRHIGPSRIEIFPSTNKETNGHANKEE